MIITAILTAIIVPHLHLCIVPNVFIVLGCTIVWVSVVIKLLVDCNREIVKMGLCFRFEIYYKVVNIGIATLGSFVLKNWYKSLYITNEHSMIQLYCLYIYAILLIFGNMSTVLLVSLTEGLFIENKFFKLCFMSWMIPFYIYQLFYVYFTTSDKVLYIIDNNYYIYWRSIVISSLYSSIIFLLKQLIRMIRKPNVLSTVKVYLPIKPTLNPRTYTINFDSNNHNYKYSLQPGLSISTLEFDHNDENKDVRSKESCLTNVSNNNYNNCKELLLVEKKQDEQVFISSMECVYSTQVSDIKQQAQEYPIYILD